MIETEEPEVLKAQAPDEAIVTARRVRKVYRSGTEVEALRGVDFTVEPGELLGVYDRVLRNAEKRVKYHYVLIDFLCRRVAGDLDAASDAAEVKWFTRQELPGLKLAEDTLDVICKGFAFVPAKK